MRKKFLGCAAAIACGALVLGPLSAATAATAVPPTTAIRDAAEPPPDPATEQQLKNQAQTFHTFGRSGQANSSVSNFAGDVLQGGQTPEQVAAAQAQVDKSLDNLLAIIPGGSPAQRGPNPLLKATVESIKQETRKMADARARGDYATLLGSGTALTTQMSLLTAQTFAGFGLDLAQNIVSAVLQFPKPAPSPSPAAAQH
ncbi:hypothetical protein [Streptomyces sp. NPDC050738]|uniref:hypothetical protein n=1 Tax=Streptomyces sp. NPDC050738 TaxID=3154744 RepID=UPI00344106ED